MTKFIVIYDSCILHPPTFRTLFIELAMTELFQAKWTNEINQEWKNSVLKKNPNITQEHVDKVEKDLGVAVPNYLVTGYENLIHSISDMPDINDRHVLAAAIRCNAEAIVTQNLKDFPKEILSKYDIEALSADTFISLQFGFSKEKVISAIKESRKWVRSKPSPEEYLQSLKKKGLTKTVAFLRDWIDFI
jgi:hypothetical protein